jgi:hypothetical protein
MKMAVGSVLTTPHAQNNGTSVQGFGFRFWFFTGPERNGRNLCFGAGILANRR